MELPAIQREYMRIQEKSNPVSVLCPGLLYIRTNRIAEVVLQIK